MITENIQGQIYTDEFSSDKSVLQASKAVFIATLATQHLPILSQFIMNHLKLKNEYIMKNHTFQR